MKIRFKYLPLALIVLIILISSGSLYNRMLNAFDVYENILYIYSMWFILFFVVFFYGKINISVYNILPSKLRDGFVMSLIMDEAEQFTNSKIENKIEKVKDLKIKFERKLLNMTVSFLYMILTLIAINFLLKMEFNWISIGLIVFIFSHVFYRIKVLG